MVVTMVKKLVAPPVAKVYKPGVLYVHVFPRKLTKKVINLSPYGVKLETWLRMYNVEYEVSTLQVLNLHAISDILLHPSHTKERYGSIEHYFSLH